MEKRIFSAQEVLFDEGAKSNAAYIVQKGSVSLSRKTRNGFSETIAEIGPGEIIGEVSLITNAPHSVTAVAKEDGHALILTQEDYLQRLERTDKVLSIILKSVINRLKSTYT